MSRLPHLGWSSHVYPLEAGDLAARPDYEGAPIPETALPPDAIVLFVRPDGPDALLRGRTRVDAAAASDPHAVVPVRVVFKPAIAKWNLLGTLLRVFRNGRRFHGTGVYHTSAQTIRGLGIERAIRRVDAPQKRGRQDRMAAMRRLQESLRTHGYDDTRPLTVMLCRTRGVEDSLRQGHHRVSACLACGVERVALSFSAAGALPGELDGRRCAPRVKAALALLECLSPAVFVCVLAAVLVHVDVSALGQGCGDMGLVRWCQIGGVLTVASLLAYRARCLARERGGLVLVAGGFFLAAVRELDGLAAYMFAAWAWMPLVALVVGATLALAWRWRDSVPAGLLAICTSRGVGYLAAGVMTALGFARLMGNASLWRAVVPGEASSAAVSRIVEEGCVLLGCGLVLCWALPFVLVGMMRRERRNPLHYFIPVLALLGVCVLADLDYRRNCAEVCMPPDWPFTVERVGDVARPTHPADLSGLSPRGGDLYWAVRDTDGELYSLRIPVDRASGRVLGCEVVGVHKLQGASDLEDVATDPLRAVVWVGDETGPSIRGFSFDGRDANARVDLPAVYLGVRKNRGLEALAIHPDGHDMWTCNENELPVDDAVSPGRIEFVRLTRFTRRTPAQPWRVSGQWAYRLESPGTGLARGRTRNGVAALCVLDDGVVLVLEREKTGKGEKASFRMRVCRVVFPGATDVSGWQSLSERPFVPVRKQIVYEAETGHAMYEGMCLGPVLDDGSRTLLLISDGDGHADERILSLRIRRNDERTAN